MRKIALAMALSLVAGCATQPREPIPVTPPGEASAAPVVRRPLPEPLVPQAPGAGTPPSAAVRPAIQVPAGLLYVCATDVGGESRQIGIEFSPKVHALCARHPEMGPCQYERDVCRRSGGRVFAANGQEITAATEAEYDRKVTRVRFRAN
ncbi:MAG TPA: hypothetical protein VMB76_07365 [Casimicrobiaceae bacterium]|jgi:hypothetical protein|nr:hypothetical protein [Casimicrobiaceae bacterium]